MHESLRQFHPVIAAWFQRQLGNPTPAQVAAWPVVAAGKSGLVVAPTGSGKTLAAFLAAIHAVAVSLLDEPRPFDGTHILYISPLKALANDIQKNLWQPLEQMTEHAAEEKQEWPHIRVGVRTGDTPARERAAMLRAPPHILITTPESLNLMLMSGAQAMLALTRYVIVDEVHALAGTKRGVFLALLLERLEELRHGVGGAHPGKGRSQKIAPGVHIAAEPLKPLVRIGLSATVRPAEVVAQWLVGRGDDGEPRPVEIVQTGQRKKLDLAVLCPFGGAKGIDEEPEIATLAPSRATEAATKRESGAKQKGTGHWPEVTREILALIRGHKSTLVFGNSRRLVERLADRLNELIAENGDANAGKPDVAANKQTSILPHHGSISKEVRLETEQALKRGEVDAVLATSSLELGIDIGALDLVVQIDSPGNIAAGLQRVGRAGHLEKATAKGRFVARGLYELPAFAALVPLMLAGQVEETRVPLNCLDVLTQQIVAACVTRPWKRAALYAVIRRAMPYASLPEKQFDSVVAMLAKRTERVTAQGLRPRISFDRMNDELVILPGSAQVVTFNSGVISDTGQFPVYLIGTQRGKKGAVKIPTPVAAEAAPREAAQARWGGGTHADGRTSPGVRLGELDEEFVYETKEGDRIVLGSQTWRVVRIDADRVLVEHADPGSSRMPFWRGESAPRSEMLGEAIARFNAEMVGRLEAQADGVIMDWLLREHHFEERAAENALAFYRRQLARGAFPLQRESGGTIVIEHFNDRTGEPIIAILCPLGSRVNYALRLALEAQFARRRLPAQVVHNDDGLIIRPPGEISGAGAIPENPLAWLKSSLLEQEIVDELESTSLFGLRFRQNAARALMLPKMMLTQRTPLWQQRLRARHLLALVKQQRNFPIMVETYRECLQDVLNIPRVAGLLRHVEEGTWNIQVVRNQGSEADASPLARSLFSQFQQTYLYAWDDPLTSSEVEPAVDQRIIDEILRGRASGDANATAAFPEGQLPWEPADETALHRRIWGLDYPARTAEELLEAIETPGANGIQWPLGDTRWDDRAVGGAEQARKMLVDLWQKRRVLLVKIGQAARWISADLLAVFLQAVGRPSTRPRLFGAKAGSNKPIAIKASDLPATILETTLSPDEAQRLLIEQGLKSFVAVPREELLESLPPMKGAAATVDGLLRDGTITALPDGRLIYTAYVEQLRAIALRRQRRLAQTADLPALQRHLLHWHHIEGAGPAAAARTGSQASTDRLEDTLDILAGMAFPLDSWQYDILPPRVPEFQANLLDAIACGGHRVWIGHAGNDVPISFWPRHMLASRPRQTGAALSATAQQVHNYLQQAGASFFFDMQMTHSLDDADLALALRELVAQGQVSNDQLESLREVLRLADNAQHDRARAPVPPRLHAVHGRHVPRASRMAGNWWKARSGGVTPGNLGGRWFLLPPAVQPANALDLAQQAADRVDRLLRRQGFACRELLEPELDGSWRDAYDVLTRMEWTGSIRRGYFVDGLAGAQFALPSTNLSAMSAVNAEAGRPDSSTSVVWLSMIDPANIWAQSASRWLTDQGLATRIPRISGSWLALIQGHPVLAAASWGQRLIPLPAPADQQAQALASVHALLPRLPRVSHPYLAIRWWDQQEILGSPAEESLKQQGFTRDTQGLRLYRQYAAPEPQRQT